MQIGKLSIWGAARGFFHAVVLALSFLAGCSVGPSYHKTSFVVPEVWRDQPAQTSHNTVALAGWWRRFNDPILDELVGYAVSGNSNVAIAKGRIREARAHLGQAVGYLLPSVSVSLSGNYGLQDPDVFSSQYRGSFDARWELDFFGKHKRAIEAARYGLEGSIEDMRAVMVTLLGDVATNYTEVRGLQQKLLIARKIAASHRKTFKLIQARLEAGDMSELDMSNAQAQMTNMEADISQMEANLSVRIHRLSVLTGRVPRFLENLLQKSVKEAKIPKPQWPIPAGIPADILRTRPDLLREERRYAQATARVGQREAERYPSIRLAGSVSTAAAKMRDLANRSTVSWFFGPSLSLPVFNGGQIISSIEAARAQRDQAFLTYQAAVLHALEEVESALVRLAKQHQRLEKLTSANEAYSRSLKLSYNLFENGNISFFELLNADRSYYSSQMALQDCRIAVAVQYIALMKALGGGWDGVVDVPHPKGVDGVLHSHMMVKK